MTETISALILQKEQQDQKGTDKTKSGDDHHQHGADRTQFNIVKILSHYHVHFRSEKKEESNNGQNGKTIISHATEPEN
ncbi:hypothetical protein [Sodalis glossinidius]|uniref:hypothetical protein n=1 Tax=Sodalis glossinidius TaxID=63612 RepID=UPI001305402A|nr:hypothetical protein [Sodalis glossinidius]